MGLFESPNPYPMMAPLIPVLTYRLLILAWGHGSRDGSDCRAEGMPTQETLTKASKSKEALVRVQGWRIPSPKPGCSCPAEPAACESAERSGSIKKRARFNPTALQADLGWACLEARFGTREVGFEIRATWLFIGNWGIRHPVEKSLKGYMWGYLIPNSPLTGLGSGNLGPPTPTPPPHQKKKKPNPASAQTPTPQPPKHLLLDGKPEHNERT